jgi:putative membrane protein insertion efficiency factor
MIRALLLKLLRGYQLYLSPLTGPCCRFWPSCSQYTYEAVQRYGCFKGLTRGIGRLLRCHPFHPGGYDPVVKAPFHPVAGSSPEWKNER